MAPNSLPILPSPHIGSWLDAHAGPLMSWCVLVAAAAIAGHLVFRLSGFPRMLGYTVPENFRTPYFSLSIRDFWARWHISLSSWLRDYVYFPLGGSRKGTARTCINLMLTFFLQYFELL